MSFEVKQTISSGTISNNKSLNHIENSDNGKKEDHKSSSAKTDVIRTRAENRLNVLNVISREDNTEPLLISLQTLTNRFPSSIFLFLYETLSIILNPPRNLMRKIEKTSFRQQKSMSELFDVYSKCKIFLVYQNTIGNCLILPKNNHFSSIFKDLDAKIINQRNINSQPTVYLDDIIRENRHKHSCVLYESCSKKSFFGPMSLPSNCLNIGRNHRKTKISEEYVVSLKLAKRNIFNGIRKVPLTYCLRKFLPRPRLPKNTTQNDKIGCVYQIPGYPSYTDRYNLPVHQATEESRSEQAISTDHSPSISSDNQYGLGHVLSSNRASFDTNTQAEQGRPRVPARHPEYENNIQRFMSFEKWPHIRPNSNTLSQSGFFYTNDSDLVRCFQCGIGLKDFSEDDDPMLEHFRHSRNCPFLPEVLGESGIASFQERLQATDPEYNRQQQWAQIQSGSALRRSTIRQPEYQTIEARLKSFINWPPHLIQTPRQLAEAGLYYIGFEDHVRCFSCGGGLRRWDPEDDPWTEHCRWFPACPFALEQKGEQFIALIQASVDQNYDANRDGEQNIVSEMELLRLKESAFEAVLDQHKSACIEMGYSEDVVGESIRELLDRGKEKPTLEEIIDLIDIIRERKSKNGHISKALESPSEENVRLKNIIYCMKCYERTVNALFLPCTHHELCMTCADSLDICPVCQRQIQEKIRTFMV